MPRPGSGCNCFLISIFSKEVGLNYLAHIFLSGDHPEVKLGNFFGDFVKGNQFEAFSPHIRQGILLHRRIDEFTDHHPEFRQAVGILRPHFARYSGIMADMYFDHFLASSFADYSTLSLSRFSCNFYFHALVRYPVLPDRIKRFIFHFTGSNRLKKYASLDGLQSSLQIMRDRKSAAIQPGLAIEMLQLHREELESHFARFFPELMVYAQSELDSQHYSYQSHRNIILH